MVVKTVEIVVVLVEETWLLLFDDSELVPVSLEDDGEVVPVG